jgi:hypothetical protein
MSQWRREAGLTYDGLRKITHISLTVLNWNELLLYPEPSPRIIAVYQFGSREQPYTSPVGPVGSFNYYLHEYQDAQETYRRKFNWEVDPGHLEEFAVNNNIANKIKDSLENDSLVKETVKESVKDPMGVPTKVYYPFPEHPFEAWRRMLGFDNRVTFCRASCTSPPQVLNYERARQRSMPKSIKAAFKKHLSQRDIQSLEYFGQEYFTLRNQASGRLH